MREAISTAMTVLLIAGAVWVGWQDLQSREAARFSGRVTWVSDGDTFKVEGHKWPVRLWGVDAPERDTAAGEAARVFMRRLVEGRMLDCEKVVVDKFGRTVARCALEGAQLSALVLEAGHGEEMCRFTKGALGRC